MDQEWEKRLNYKNELKSVGKRKGTIQGEQREVRQ